MKKSFKAIIMMVVLSLSQPLLAQDFGYAKDKAFYKAHWNEVVRDLGPDTPLFGAQYVLFDFDKDHTAELYLWLSMHEEYVYTIKDNKVVRVSDASSRKEDGKYSLREFYAHFMAPYEMLLDKSIDKRYNTEQHLYEMSDIPSLWFKLNPKVQGKFNIRSAIDAIYCFDCETLSDIMRALSTGEYSKEYIDEYVCDVANGYACASVKGEITNRAEFCYWNLKNGEKLLAMHYHLSNRLPNATETEWFEQTLFMKYNPKTQRLTPVVAPIQNFNFMHECNFSLPRRGKNITLIGAEEKVLTWTGNGFKF